MKRRFHITSDTRPEQNYFANLTVLSVVFLLCRLNFITFGYFIPCFPLYNFEFINKSLMEDKNIINRTGRHTKIAILWVAVMCGLTLHSLADLMPLFWNEAIAISKTGHAPEGLLTFMMSISYLVPVCGILLSLYGKTRSWNILNGLLATFILLFNLFPHL